VLQANEDSLLALAEHLPGEGAEALVDLATAGKPKPAPDADPFAHSNAQRRFRVMRGAEELAQVPTRRGAGLHRLAAEWGVWRPGRQNQGRWGCKARSTTEEQTMQIESIEIQNYRAFRLAKLDNLPRMAALVGANGTGKSTLFDVFSFLKDALAFNAGKAVARRGGMRELRSRGETGPVRFEIKFRESGGRLATYELAIDESNGRVAVEREVLKFRRGQRGKPWHFIDFSCGKGTAITNEQQYGEEGATEARAEYALDEDDVLAIKGLGQFKDFRVVAEFRALIENWQISDFHIAEARPSAEEGYAEHLSTRGDNLAQVAQYLFQYHPERFRAVLEAMERRVPGVSKVEAKPTEDGRLVLRFQDGSFRDPFIARFVSDGTIKMFAYLVLLHDPKPFPLLAIEEPENQLYPELLPELAEEFRDYARRGGQVFVSSHSPDFLNALKLEEIYCLRKVNGFTTITHASDSENLRALVEAGDLPGYLWKQGLFEGLNR
jgi:predicted ATPase